MYIDRELYNCTRKYAELENSHHMFLATLIYQAGAYFTLIVRIGNFILLMYVNQYGANIRLLLAKVLTFIRHVYLFCCDFWDDFLLLRDVSEWVNSECSECVIPYLKISS